jgi:flagellin
MAMVIKNNMAAQLALGELNKNNNKLSNSLKKVSSGMKINGAGDDASGYSISERMRVQKRGLDQDDANAQNASSLLKTADGAISSSIDILKTMKEKAINAANDTNTDADRATIQKELDQAIDQLDDNANLTFNNKRLFDGAADAGNELKQLVVKGLNSEWIESSLDLIKDTYGISFQDDTATVRDIKLNFVDTPPSGMEKALAWVSFSSPQGGSATELSLNVNTQFYDSLDFNDPNGKSKKTTAYLDRTIAHELTHAVMAANIKGMGDKTGGTPLFLVEGAAEYTHGIDDQRISALSALNANTIDSDAGEDLYAAGYAFLHYLNARSGHDGYAMKRMVQTLVTHGGNTAGVDAAIAAASKGGFSTKDEAVAAFKKDMSAYADVKDFLREKCDIELERGPMNGPYDTGSATGSKSWNGEQANGDQVVLEGKSPRFWWYPSSETSTIEGLTVEWGDYPQPDLTDAGFRFQVGTKANQNIFAAFSDIHANALGLRSDQGENISVQTRADAKRAMTICDRALRKALDQSTTIGALTSRMEYTSRNLTTASENVQSAESTIRDADMAKEMTEYTKNNVLQQAAQSMLAQANQTSSGVLNLLQG